MCDLSPCKETDMSRKNSISDRSKQNDSSIASGSSLATSALDRLRYNLSPVTSYYKPLIKSFSRRDDSPAKVSIVSEFSEMKTIIFFSLNLSLFVVNEKVILILYFPIGTLVDFIFKIEKRCNR